MYEGHMYLPKVCHAHRLGHIPSLQCPAPLSKGTYEQELIHCLHQSGTDEASELQVPSGTMRQIACSR